MSARLTIVLIACAFAGAPYAASQAQLRSQATIGVRTDIREPVAIAGATSPRRPLPPRPCAEVIITSAAGGGLFGWFFGSTVASIGMMSHARRDQTVYLSIAAFAILSVAIHGSEYGCFD